MVHMAQLLQVGDAKRLHETRHTLPVGTAGARCGGLRIDGFQLPVDASKVAKARHRSQTRSISGFSSGAPATDGSFQAFSPGLNRGVVHDMPGIDLGHGFDGQLALRLTVDPGGQCLLDDPAPTG
jgi:hypothetical protein